MRLPSEFEVAVATPARVPIEHALVWLNTRVLGQDYFRPFLGLTDVQGVVRVTENDLTRKFVYNRDFYPMDFKVPLEECDDEVVVGIEGGTAFEEHRQAALAASWVTPEAKAMWRRAGNASLQSVSQLVRLPSSGERVTVRLEADSARSSV